MKKEFGWTKTLLKVYRYLERICGAIDKIIMQSALNSSNILGQNYFYNNVYSITQKLIDLSDRKVTLINLKILIEDVLKGLDENDAQLLIEKYFDDNKFKDIAEKRGVSIRTIFRKVEVAEINFSKRLNMLGYNDLRLEEFLAKENWIMQVHDRLCDANEEDFSLSNAYLAKAVSM